MIIFQTTGTLRNQSQGWFWVCPQLRTFWKLFQKKMLSVSSTMGILRIQSAGRCVVSPQSLEFGYSSLLEDVEGITFSPIWAVDPFLLRSNALERPTLLWPGVLRNISSIQLREAPTGKKQLYVGFFLGRGKVELFFSAHLLLLLTYWPRRTSWWTLPYRPHGLLGWQSWWTSSCKSTPLHYTTLHYTTPRPPTARLHVPHDTESLEVHHEVSLPAGWNLWFENWSDF